MVLSLKALLLTSSLLLSSEAVPTVQRRAEVPTKPT